MKKQAIKNNAGKTSLFLLIVYTWFGALLGSYIHFWENQFPTAVGFAYGVTWVLIAFYLLIWMLEVTDSGDNI